MTTLHKHFRDARESRGPGAQLALDFCTIKKPKFDLGYRSNMGNTTLQNDKSTVAAVTAVKAATVVTAATVVASPCSKEFPMHYKLGKKLGEGAYGKVYECTAETIGSPNPSGSPSGSPSGNLSNPRVFVVKHICNIFENPAVAYAVLREIHILRHLYRLHPNIVPLHEVYIRRGQTKDNFQDIFLVSGKSRS